MSIIHEALKKAGQPVLLEIKSESKVKMPLGRRQKSPINWGPLLVVFILVLVVSPILTPLMSRSYKSNVDESAASSHMKAQFAVEEAPIIPPATAVVAIPTLPNFMLNGLVYANEGSYCLINGKVVKLGEVIEGATLIKVTPDSAQLDYQGRKIILPANA